MTAQEWAELVTYLINWCWPYATQNERQELVTLRAVVAATLEKSRHVDPKG